VSAAVREATALPAEALERPKEARDLIDEAAAMNSLEPGMAGPLHGYEGALDALSQHLALSSRGSTTRRSS
jgi:hypothetical protein